MTAESKIAPKTKKYHADKLIKNIRKSMVNTDVRIAKKSFFTHSQSAGLTIEVSCNLFKSSC